MALDLSDAVALAKDLMKTSGDFVAHDPGLADQFSKRAFEICDDLGIDRATLGQLSDEQQREHEQPEAAVPMQDLIDEIAEEDATLSSQDLEPADADLVDRVEEEARRTNDQLRDLLQQQARVLQSVRDPEDGTEIKTKKRGFKLFGRTPADEDVDALQSA